MIGEKLTRKHELRSVNPSSDIRVRGAHVYAPKNEKNHPLEADGTAKKVGQGGFKEITASYEKGAGTHKNQTGEEELNKEKNITKKDWLRGGGWGGKEEREEMHLAKFDLWRG